LHRDAIHKRQYESVGEVVADVLQMYGNCTVYNDDASIMGEEATRQRREFQKFCKKHRLV
jgi:hypothetical protein